jgi:hypothetical protein
MNSEEMNSEEMNSEEMNSEEMNNEVYFTVYVFVMNSSCLLRVFILYIK